MIVRRIVAAGAVLALSGCVAAYTWEDFTKGSAGERTSDSGTVADANSSSSSSGDASNEASVTIEAGTCASGTKVFGKIAYDASPAGGPGRVCRFEEVVSQDELWAALDVADNGDPSQLDGREVTGCIGVELEDAFVLRAIGVRVTPHHDGCGLSECTSQCGTGHTVDLFVGPSRDELHFVQQETADEARNVQVSTAGSGPVRVVVVCRGPWGTGRDDMLVDALWGICN